MLVSTQSFFELQKKGQPPRFSPFQKPRVGQSTTPVCSQILVRLKIQGGAAIFATCDVKSGREWI
jgi:hypothetical protein